MWQSHSYFLAVPIILFSFLWPYAKLLIMLYAWLVPMTVAVRGPLLVFLDQIGKWSLTDNFCMFLLVVMFRVRWEGVSQYGAAGEGSRQEGGQTYHLRMTNKSQKRIAHVIWPPRTSPDLF